LAAEEEGGTVLEHLEAYERQTGKVHPMLLDAPRLPEGCEQLWPIFSELHSCRGNYGFGPCRITYADIDAFQRVSGVTLRPWELEAVRKADAAYLEKQRTPDGD
jgi:hypothetical protein